VVAELGELRGWIERRRLQRAALRAAEPDHRQYPVASEGLAAYYAYRASTARTAGATFGFIAAGCYCAAGYWGRAISAVAAANAKEWACKRGLVVGDVPGRR